MTRGMTMEPGAPGDRRSSERLEARVVGDVQGVGFRWFVQREAARRGLVGWVANDAQGGVTVVAEGAPGALDGLQAALASGPPGARVRAVTTDRLPPSHGFVRFEIRAGSHPGD